jgi:glyoxylate utilization-related uncharacterized protein
MARDHVEFLDPATMAWSDADLPGFPEGTREKTLSADDATGASTRLVSVPAGATATPAAAGADAEVFVVSGGLRIDDRGLRRLDYAHVPAGAAVTYGTTERCRLLYMPDGDPGAGVEADPDAAPAVTDVGAMDWEQPETEGFPDGAARKSLRYDEATGAATWLLGVLPGWRETRVEVHPVVEEGYQVQGSMTSDRGRFAAGKYFWRPPEVPHGPFETSVGCLTLFRCDGEFAVEYVRDTADGGAV